MLVSGLCLANNALRIILTLLFKKIFWKAKQNTQTSVISCSKIFCFTLTFQLSLENYFLFNGLEIETGYQHLCSCHQLPGTSLLVCSYVWSCPCYVSMSSVAGEPVELPH